MPRDDLGVGIQGCWGTDAQQGQDIFLLWLFHIVVWQTPKQRCTAIFLPLKNKLKKNKVCQYTKAYQEINHSEFCPQKSWTLTS